ncbi:Uncharacterised protein [Chlamydia trachomatis]|nr:Uncharacterised protein [Chlamydia trachomatis]
MIKELSNGKKKIEVEFYFEQSYKKFFINNVEELFSHDDKYYFFPLLFFNKNQIEYNSLLLLNELKNFLNSKDVTYKQKSILIDDNDLGE